MRSHRSEVQPAHASEGMAPGRVFAVCLLLLTGCGGGADSSPKTSADGDRKDVKSSAAVPVGSAAIPVDTTASLRASHAQAVQLLVDDDLIGFWEFYMPLEELRQMRQRGDIGSQLADSRRHGKFKPRMLAIFQQLQTVTPELAGDGTLAVYRIRNPGRANSTGDDSLPEPPVDRRGFDGDLHEALQQASEALKTGGVAEFLEKMSPLSLPAGDPQSSAHAELLSQLSAMPELLESMQRDLQRLATAEPRLEADGLVAVFAATSQYPEVRFQKVNGHWRMFDHTAPLQKIQQEQLHQTARVDYLTIEFERIGPTWRLVKFFE